MSAPIPQPELDRVQADLNVIQRAMAFHPSFGREMVVFGVLLAAGAGIAASISFSSEGDWNQLAPFGAVVMLCLLWMYYRSRRVENLGHEIKLQVGLSITIYTAVVGAAAGYSMAAVAGPALGAARTAGLYAASVGYLLVFLLILVLNAGKSRERCYCLGLALAPLLAGLLIPITDPRYSYFLGHSFMAVGALAAAAIQWTQLKQARSQHGAD